MTTLLFSWAISGLVIGYAGDSHDVEVIGWILLGMAIVFAALASIRSAYVRNANASINLERNERRRTGGAL